jgi:hypothetical protein
VEYECDLAGRACGHSHANGDEHTQSISHSNGNFNFITNPYFNSNIRTKCDNDGHSFRNTNLHPNCNSDSDPHCQSYDDCRANGHCHGNRFAYDDVHAHINSDRTANDARAILALDLTCLRTSGQHLNTHQGAYL